MDVQSIGQESGGRTQPLLEQDLWCSFKNEGSQASRQRLFSTYLPIAKRIAWRHARDEMRGTVEYNELVQLAVVGLLEAIDRFKPELGIPFKYYCTRRIRGAILNGIAKLTEVNEQISTRRQIARDRMRSVSGKRGNASSLDEILDLLGDIAESLALGLILDCAASTPDEVRDPARDAYETMAWKQAVSTLREEVGRLPEQQQNVVRYHYLEGVPFEEIAKLFGLSKGRISQIHRSGLEALRKRLASFGQFRLEG